MRAAGNKWLPNLSVESLFHIGGATVLILVLLFFGTIPSCRKGACVDVRVKQLRAKWAEHLALMPFSAEVAGVAADLEQVVAEPELVPLGREEFGEIHSMLQGQAAAQKLRLMRVVPQVVTVDAGRFLCATITVEGAFSQFPGFVRGMMKWPCFYCIDKLTVNQGGSVEQLEVVAWLAVKQQGEEP
jgi:hypothetical protein